MARSKTSTTASPASAAGERAVQHWTSRLLPMTAAPAGAVAEGVAIAAMHHYWGGSPTTTALYASGLSLSGAAATGYTYVAAGGHRTHLRALGTLTAGAASVAAVFGMVDGFGPISGPYTVGGIAFSVLWAIRQAMKSADENGGHPLGMLGKVIDAEKHHISNMRRSGKGTVSAVVTAKNGATVDELQGSLGALAAATGIPRGGAVLRVEEENASIGYLEITVADLLKMTIPWPGVQTGGLCTDPIPLALYANGDEFAGYALTADGDIEHDLIIGTTGSGKSEHGFVYMGTQCTRRQVNQIAIDLTKGQQTFGAIRHGLTRNGMLITDERTARKVLKALAGPVCKARTNYLTSEGMTKWAPRTPRGTKTKINLLEVWIEEAADLADGETYAEMCRRCRSAGIKIHTSLQRATWTNMSTDARAFHGGAICFGVRDEEDARFGLPDHVVDAGAIPTWRNTKPGYHYCCALRAPEDKWTTRLRNYYVHDRSLMAAAVTRAASVVDPMDPITAKAFGSLWDKRTIWTAPTGIAGSPDLMYADPDQEMQALVDGRVPALDGGPAAERAAVTTGPRPGGPAVTEDQVAAMTAAALSSDSNGTDTEEEQDTDDMDDSELTDAHRIELNEAADDILGGLNRARRQLIDEALEGDPTLGDPADEYDDTEDQEVRPATDTPLDFGDGDENSKATPEEARLALDTLLDQWLREGKDTFAPADLKDLLKGLPRTRFWFFHQRDRLVDAGVIRETGDIGVYEIIQSPFVGAETGGQ